jgi:hypothetical protein
VLRNGRVLPGLQMNTEPQNGNAQKGCHHLSTRSIICSAARSWCLAEGPPPAISAAWRKRVNGPARLVERTGLEALRPFHMSDVLPCIRAFRYSSYVLPSVLKLLEPDIKEGAHSLTVRTGWIFSTPHDCIAKMRLSARRAILVHPELFQHSPGCDVWYIRNTDDVIALSAIKGIAKDR